LAAAATFFMKWFQLITLRFGCALKNDDKMRREEEKERIRKEQQFFTAYS